MVSVGKRTFFFCDRDVVVLSILHINNPNAQVEVLVLISPNRVVVPIFKIVEIELVVDLDPGTVIIQLLDVYDPTAEFEI